MRQEQHPYLSLSVPRASEFPEGGGVTSAKGGVTAVRGGVVMVEGTGATGPVPAPGPGWVEAVLPDGVAAMTGAPDVRAPASDAGCLFAAAFSANSRANC